MAVQFGTYSCINWIRTLPYVRAWVGLPRSGLVVVGAQTPEFGFEQEIGGVRRALAAMGVGYPVVLDNAYAIWSAFENRYWPALYVLDGEGSVRYHHFGEGAYEESETIIRGLLGVDGDGSTRRSRGELAADWDSLRSPETYVGSARGERRARDGAGGLGLNQWALSGRWAVDDESAVLEAGGGSITYRFGARDLNLVLTPPASGAAVRFEVRLDGRPPARRTAATSTSGGPARWTSRGSTSSSARPSRRRPHLRDQLPRPGRPGLRLHLRLDADHPAGPGIPRARGAGRGAMLGRSSTTGGSTPMRPDIVPGAAFPDYELPDHTSTPRRLSEIQGDDPLILTLARGHYCPKEHQQHLELAANYPKIAVGYTQVATISTDEHHTSQEFRASTGAQWPFLEDPGRIVQKDLDIQEYTDPDNDPMIPHTLVLKPGLVVHRIYNGYWFWGRPSFADLWRDLRELMAEIRPDWDLSSPGLREAWEAGDYAKFHGWDRRAPAPSSPV